MVSSRCLPVRPISGALAAMTAVALLAGCGSSQSGFAPAGSTQLNAGMIVPAACRYHGGVRATPCLVRLTASNPGPITVTLRTPHGSKGTIVEHDTCGGASGKASISGSGDTWQVTAGAIEGDCIARFNYHNNAQKVGWVEVKIENQV